MSLKNKCLEQQNLWYILYRQFYNVSSTMCILFYLILSLLYNSAATFCRSEFIFVAVFMKNFLHFSFWNWFLFLWQLISSALQLIFLGFSLSNCFVSCIRKTAFSLSLSLSLSSLSLCIRITMNVYSYCLKNPLTKHYSYIFLC